MTTEAAVTSDAHTWEASIGEIVPLSTQLVSPALAEAFGFPSHAGAIPVVDRNTTAAVGQQEKGTQQLSAASVPPMQDFRAKSLEGFQNHFMDARLNPLASEAQRPLLSSLYAGQAGNPSPYRQPGQQEALSEVQLQTQFQSQPPGMGLAFPGMQGLYGMPFAGAEQPAVMGGRYPAGAPAAFPSWLDQQQPAQVAQQPAQQPIAQQSLQAQQGGTQQRRPAPAGQEPPIGSDTENADEQQARALKRPRLVWTAQLHQRFVDAVKQLGVKNAVPKTIMQLMNVDGLTRENVASHLQKYRLQLRKDDPMQDEDAGQDGGEDRDAAEDGNAPGDAEVPQC